MNFNSKSREKNHFLEKRLNERSENNNGKGKRRRRGGEEIEKEGGGERNGGEEMQKEGGGNSMDDRVPRTSGFAWEDNNSLILSRRFINQRGRERWICRDPNFRSFSHI